MQNSQCTARAIKFSELNPLNEKTQKFEGKYPRNGNAFNRSARRPPSEITIQQFISKNNGTQATSTGTRNPERKEPVALTTRDNSSKEPRERKAKKQRRNTDLGNSRNYTGYEKRTTMERQGTTMDIHMPRRRTVQDTSTAAKRAQRRKDDHRRKGESPEHRIQTSSRVLRKLYTSHIEARTSTARGGNQIGARRTVTRRQREILQQRRRSLHQKTDTR